MKKINVKEVIDLYIKNFSGNEISKIFNISNTYVYTILKNNNITRRSHKENSTKLNKDENYFETIDSKDKAYFLGLLMADGSVDERKFYISLQSIDEYILYKFKNYLKYDGNIKKQKPHKATYSGQSILQVYSIKICKDLSKYGIVQNKAFITYFPNIPEKFHSHFIRGVFDGDGCVRIDKRSNSLCFGLTGNNKLLEKIQEILKEECNLLFMKTKKINNSYTFEYSGNKICKKIYEYLYKDCEDLYLTRKKEKFDSVLDKLKTNIK